MTMNPFEQSTQQLLRFLTSHADWEIIDYIRQEVQHDAPESVPTADELLTFFRSPDAPTELDTYQQMLATDRLLEYCPTLLVRGTHEGSERFWQCHSSPFYPDPCP